MQSSVYEKKWIVVILLGICFIIATEAMPNDDIDFNEERKFCGRRLPETITRLCEIQRRSLIMSKKSSNYFHSEMVSNTDILLANSTQILTKKNFP